MNDFDGRGAPKWLADPFGKPKLRQNKYKDRIAQLEAERDELRNILDAKGAYHGHLPSDIGSLLVERDEMRAEVQELRDDLQQHLNEVVKMSAAASDATAENERLRAVVEAAFKWRSAATHTSGTWKPWELPLIDALAAVEGDR